MIIYYHFNKIEYTKVFMFLNLKNLFNEIKLFNIIIVTSMN